MAYIPIGQRLPLRAGVRAISAKQTPRPRLKEGRFRETNSVPGAALSAGRAAPAPASPGIRPPGRRGSMHPGRVRDADEEPLWALQSEHRLTPFFFLRPDKNRVACCC